MGRTGMLRGTLAVFLALPLLAGPSGGALLKKGAPFLPFGLRAIDGTGYIAKLENGVLTLITETRGNDGPRRVETHPAAVLLDFWATWCVPCRAGMPAMQKMHDRFRPRPDQTSGGLNLFGISLDIDGSAVVKPFFDRLRFTYPMLADPIPGLNETGLLRSAQDMKIPYGAEEIPVVYLIDSKGRIVYSHMGFAKNKMAELENAVLAAVPELKK